MLLWFSFKLKPKTDGNLITVTTMWQYMNSIIIILIVVIIIHWVGTCSTCRIAICWCVCQWQWDSNTSFDVAPYLLFPFTSKPHLMWASWSAVGNDCGFWQPALMSISPLSAPAQMTDNDTGLMAVFQNNPHKPVPGWLHSGFYWTKDDGGDGDKMCKAPVRSSITTNKPTLCFLQTRCPSCCWANNVKALKGSLFLLGHQCPLRRT